MDCSTRRIAPMPTASPAMKETIMEVVELFVQVMEDSFMLRMEIL